MKLFRITSIILNIFLIFSSYGQQPRKAWTVFVYIAADNDLEQFAQPNLRQMMQVGSHADLHLVAYLAQKKHGLKTGKLLHIEKNRIKVISTQYNADSGSRDTFEHACMDVINEFPSDHLAIIGWDHGSGPLNRIVRGIAYDFTTGHYLTDIDVLLVMQKISQKINRKVDILAYDACLMAGIELQAPYASYVEYVVASQETIPGTGWDYSRALKSITAGSSAADVAQAWVQAYNAAYGPYIKDYTLSAVDLTQAQKVAENVNQVAKVLASLLSVQEGRSVTNFMRKITSRFLVTAFDSPDYDYLDLDHLYANMLNYVSLIKVTSSEYLITELQELVAQGRQLITQAVIKQTAGPAYPHAKGISIYWPRITMHHSYAKLAWSLAYPEWMNFIAQYLSLREAKELN